MQTNLGVAQISIKPYQQTLAYINKVLGINPIHLAITFNKILTFFQLKQYNGKHFKREKYIKLDANSSQTIKTKKALL